MSRYEATVAGTKLMMLPTDVRLLARFEHISC